MAGCILSSSTTRNGIIATIVGVFIILSVVVTVSQGQIKKEDQHKMKTLYERLQERKPNPRTCKEKGLCCQGQNNTCFVFGPRVDRSETEPRCYCDSNCLIMGDCCGDYHLSCESKDCEVGDWAEWTTCDNPCGYGTRKRLRNVQTYPDNGGQNCPVLKQRRACVGFEQEICQQNMIGEQNEEKAEQARILPIEFGKARAMKKYDPWRGILKNLYHQYFNQVFTRATYRGKFRVTKTHHGCENSEWANVLKVNTTVCIECQPVAMNRDIGMRCLGHGVYNHKTQWTAVDVKHCHGEWMMIGQHEPQVCEYDIDDERRKNFIFI